MGRAGTAPRPASVLRLQGSALAKGRAAEEGAYPRPAVPPRPPHLTGLAGSEWDRIAPLLVTAGTLAESDMMVLLGYVEGVSDMVRYRAALDEHGSVWVEAGRLRNSPYVALYEAATKRADRFGRQLGLSAAARRSVARGQTESSAAAGPTPFRRSGA